MNDTDRSQQQYCYGQEKRMDKYLDDGLSLWAALTIPAQLNQCFDNAWRMFLDIIPDAFCSGGRFIEGWYVIDLPEKVVMTEHGWCELSDGTIIDPTVVLLFPPNHPIFYFPGVSRSQEEVATLLAEGKWLPYVRGEEYGADGLGHPGYKAAYEAAKRKVVSLAHAVHPPKAEEYLQAQVVDDEQWEKENAHQGTIVLLLPQDDQEWGEQ